MSKRKCQKLHFSLVSSVATAPQLMYRMRFSGLRALCLSTASISAAAMLDPLQCTMKGAFWSVAAFRASSASAG